MLFYKDNASFALLCVPQFLQTGSDVEIVPKPEL